MIYTTRPSSVCLWHLRQCEPTRSRHGWVTLSITHCIRLNLQLHTIDLVRTCRISSNCTVAWQLAIFQLTRRIARFLGDSWASCFSWGICQHCPMAAVSVLIGPCCPALLESYSRKCAYCGIIGQIKWWWWWWWWWRKSARMRECIGLLPAATEAARCHTACRKARRRSAFQTPQIPARSASSEISTQTNSFTSHEVKNLEFKHVNTTFLDVFWLPGTT